MRAFLDVDREESDRAKQERNATILELVQALKQVVSATSRPGSPAALKQHEIGNISDSIQSLLFQIPTQKAPKEPIVARSKATTTYPAFSATSPSDRIDRSIRPVHRDPLKSVQGLRHFSPSKLEKHNSVAKSQSLLVRDRINRSESNDPYAGNKVH